MRSNNQRFSSINLKTTTSVALVLIIQTSIWIACISTRRVKIIIITTWTVDSVAHEKC